MTRPLVVAIDGPSGVGKSSVGRRLAEELGVPYLDTGAMYRAIGLLARRRGVPLPIAEPEEVADLARVADVRLVAGARGLRTLLDGEDVSEAIRQPEISLYASAVSAIPGVRRRLAALQRELALAGGGVLEGRDIGTKVVPEATAKLFLDAREEVRSLRRFRELAAKGTPQPLEEVRSQMRARDEADSTRADSPLTCDERYVRIDTSDLSLDEVVRACRAAVEAAAAVDPTRKAV